MRFVKLDNLEKKHYLINIILENEIECIKTLE